MLVLSMKDKPLPYQKRWSFSLILTISSLKSLSYLLIKLDMTTLGGFCLSYSSISFTSFLIFFTVIISFSISLVQQCMIITSSGVVWSCSAKKVFVKISQNSQMFPLAHVVPVNFTKF